MEERLNEQMDDMMEILNSPSKEHTKNRTGIQVEHLDKSPKTVKPWVTFKGRIPGEGSKVLVNHDGDLNHLVPVKLTTDFKKGRANYEFDGMENELKIYTDRDRDGNVIYLMFQNVEL